MPSLSTQLLVIGGGATGLGVAWDACLRGLKVVLVEQGNIGQGTSGRYHGLLHSGGRYVISDPASARDCARENQVLRRLVPHTIEDTGGFFASTHLDPPDFADRWAQAAGEAGVEASEIAVSEARRAEPLLTSRLDRVFAVRDASLDSFDLLHALVHAIRGAGGQVWLRHRVDRLIRQGDRILGAEVYALRSGESRTVHADLVVNAAGPWAGEVAQLAGVDLPVALGKGTMIAMATRLVNTVVNRLKPPSDGDIIVPIGTVAVLGTTDVPVAHPTDLTIEPWEVDLLLSEAEALIPNISSRRALRAWAGVRPLVDPSHLRAEADTRHMPRAHLILDHAHRHGLAGLISVMGGKLTTFRLMAEQTLDLACQHLGHQAPCRTADTPLETHVPHQYYALPGRLSELEHTPRNQPPFVVCECETITRQQIEHALQDSDTIDLDDVRRDLRLGMGPCQAGFCAYRAAAILQARSPTPAHLWLRQFLEERWRGVHALAWGSGLRQMELTRRIYLELLATVPDRQEPAR